jgi:hypothetical protein
MGQAFCSTIRRSTPGSSGGCRPIGVKRRGRRFLRRASNSRRRPTPMPSRVSPTEAVRASSPPRSSVCSPTAKRSPRIYGSLPNTTRGSATPTWSSAPSARPADGSRSSAGSPARPPACPSPGPCSTGPRAAGAASPTPQSSPGTSPSYASNSTNPLPRDQPSTESVTTAA